MRRASLTIAVLAILVAMSPAVRAEEGEERTARDLAELRAAEDEGRVARCAAIARGLANDLVEHWVRQLKSALPDAPEGWTSPPPDGSWLWGGEDGVTFARTYERGEGGEVQIRIDLAPNPWDKPHEGNLPWIRYARDRARESGRQTEVRFAGRQAFLLGEDEGRLVLGLVLAHGATLGAVTYGDVSREDLVGTFGGAIDLAALEQHLWRQDEGESSALAGVGSLTALWEARRLGEAFDMARSLSERYEREVALRMQELLPEAPEGWSAGAMRLVAAGAERDYAPGTEGRVSVRIGWMAAPNVNGHLDAFRNPERRRDSQTVEEVGRLSLLLEEYRPYGEAHLRARGFFVDGHFQLVATGYDLGREEWLEPLLGGLDPERIEATLAKLW